MQRLDPRKGTHRDAVRFEVCIVQEQIPAGEPPRLAVEIIYVADLAGTVPLLGIVAMPPVESPPGMHRHVHLDPVSLERLHSQPRQHVRQHAAELQAEPGTDVPHYPPVRHPGGAGLSLQVVLAHLRGDESVARRRYQREQPILLCRRQEIRQPYERHWSETRRRGVRHPAATQDRKRPRRGRMVGVRHAQAPIRVERRGELPPPPLDVTEPLQCLRLVRARRERPLQDRLGLVEEPARLQRDDNGMRP